MLSAKEGTSLNRLLALFLWPVLVVRIARSQNLDSGIAAYERGDYAAALAQLRPLADRGDTTAQLYMALTVSARVPKDFTEAVKWYCKAAEKGSEWAILNLATMYHRGSGVPKDYGEAMKWYRRGSEQKYEGGTVHWLFHAKIGQMYLRGEGAQQDWKEAAKWFRVAAESGD